jgi:hypothetical protein
MLIVGPRGAVDVIKIKHINGNGWKFQELADVHRMPWAFL